MGGAMEIAAEAGGDRPQGRKRMEQSWEIRDSGLSCLLRKGTLSASLLLREGQWGTDRARVETNRPSVETNNQGKICSLLP